MTPEEVERIVRIMISTEGYPLDWLLPLFGAFVGCFLGSYIMKKGEHLATKEDFESLLEHVKKTTSETENIKVELAKGTWSHQQKWVLKEKYYSGILEALYILRASVRSRLDHYMEPGSEYRDREINDNANFQAQSKIWDDAMEKLNFLHGPAMMVISANAIAALEEFYKADREASNFSFHNKEYLDDVRKSVDITYKLIVEEARQELR